MTPPALKATAVRSVRPYQIFTLLDDPPSQRIVRLQVPARRSGGSLTLLESMLLVSAARIVNAKKALEIGTFLGSTTLNLGLNIPGEIVTLDLDPESAGDVEQHTADAPLTRIHLNTPKLDFHGSEIEPRVRTLTGDSTAFDFSPFAGSFDLVFIDGGHDGRTVEADTKSAFQVVRRDKPSCILWHDYANRDYPELSAFMDELAAREPIYHVGDTMLCAWFHGEEIQAKLAASL